MKVSGNNSTSKTSLVLNYRAVNLVFYLICILGTRALMHFPYVTFILRRLGILSRTQIFKIILFSPGCKYSLAADRSSSHYPLKSLRTCFARTILSAALSYASPPLQTVGIDQPWPTVAEVGTHSTRPMPLAPHQCQRYLSRCLTSFIYSPYPGTICKQTYGNI